MRFNKEDDCEDYDGFSSFLRSKYIDGNEVCANEKFDRGYNQGNGDDIIRFISCQCSKCSPRY
ncbi:MAG: hypothetical protein GOVbin631_51 [Prokaryotic dsDNA virus sp.]|nr:MAG: hypothetical protein GOVbin631_51 [Prokaryotic dsDNA virus sp.]